MPHSGAMSAPTTETLRGEPLGRGGAAALPGELSPRRLLRRLAEVVGLLSVLVLVALLAPGLGEIRERLGGASPAWLCLAVALEGLSCGSYVLMFRPVFCRRLSWRTSAEIGWSELAAGSLLPASGAGGLALGAWILHRGGMSGERIARRSVAFFLIKSSVNFVAVAALGALLAGGLLGPPRSPLLSALPAALSVAVMALVLALSRLGPRPGAGAGASGLRRAVGAARESVVGGAGEALQILRSGDLLVVAGALGYFAFDNAVLWAAFRAVGAEVPLSVVMMGYLIGQLGGLLPLPGGVGGIDGGLIGTLVVYGAPAGPAAAAVLAYRVILFWLPLLGGAVAFASLRRALARSLRADLCEPVRAG